MIDVGVVEDTCIACDDAGKLSLHLFFPIVIEWPVWEAHRAVSASLQTDLHLSLIRCHVTLREAFQVALKDQGGTQYRRILAALSFEKLIQIS